MFHLAVAHTFSFTPPTFHWHPSSAGLPSGADVEALALGPAGLYAGTFGDGIYRSTDNGATWITATAGITLPLYVQNALAVDPFSATVYVGDYYGGGLYRSTNGGDSWDWVLPGARVRAVATSPITPGLVLAGDRQAGLYRSEDGGDTWEHISGMAGLSETHIYALTFALTAPYTAYAGAAQSVYASGDGGVSWRFLGEFSSTVYALAAAPPTLLIGTYSNGLYRSTDNGYTWIPANSGLPAGAWVTVLAFDPFTPTVLYAGLWEGQVYRSTDGGVTWAGLDHIGYVYALAVHPTARTVLWAGTSNNGVLRGSTLDHLTIDPVSSPQYIYRSFPITLTACDALGFPLSALPPGVLVAVAGRDKALARTLANGYEGIAVLTDTTGTVTPTVVVLSDGVAHPQVTIGRVAAGVVITATLRDGPATTSNPFDVRWYMQIYLPVIAKNR